jgi:gas vesicle protein
MNDLERPAISNVLLGFLVGAAVGAAVAYLTAPRTGRETREKIRDWMGEAGATLSRVPRAVGDAYTRSTQAAKDSFAESMREGEKRSDA